MKITTVSPIIGNGFIAKNFLKTKKNLIKSKTVLYTAGISNSKTINKKKLIREFLRIKSYLKNFDNKKKLIYISSFSVFDPQRNKSLYVKNKIKIEKFLQKKNINHLIIRLPEIIGKNKNKRTLVNFIFNRIKDGKNFDVWKNSLRNIVDIADAVKIINKIIISGLNKKKTVNIISKYFYSPENIIKILEIKLNKKADYKYLYLKKRKLKKHKPYYVKSNSNKENYLKKIINKYY